LFSTATINPVIIRPHIAFTDGRTKTINPVIIRPHIVFIEGRQQRQLNHNTYYD
jgi:hypothetical protein